MVEIQKGEREMIIYSLLFLSGTVAGGIGGWIACRKWGTQADAVAKVVDSVVPGAKL